MIEIRQSVFETNSSSSTHNIHIEPLQFNEQLETKIKDIVNKHPCVEGNILKIKPDEFDWIDGIQTNFYTKLSYVITSILMESNDKIIIPAIELPEENKNEKIQKIADYINNELESKEFQFIKNFIKNHFGLSLMVIPRFNEFWYLGFIDSNDWDTYRKAIYDHNDLSDVIFYNYLFNDKSYVDIDNDDY